MVEQGILPNNGPPRPCDDPTNEDHLYEVITTPCARGYEARVWDGPTIIATNAPGIFFCEGEIVCSRQWKMCTDAQGNITTQLISSKELNPDTGEEYPVGTTSCGESDIHPYPEGVITGVGDLTGISFDIAIDAVGPGTTPCLQTCGD
jgi:hypothetical protein